MHDISSQNQNDFPCQDGGIGPVTRIGDNACKTLQEGAESFLHEMFTGKSTESAMYGPITKYHKA